MNEVSQNAYAQEVLARAKKASQMYLGLPSSTESSNEQNMRDLLFAADVTIFTIERIIAVLPNELGIDRNDPNWQNAVNKMKLRLFEDD